MRGFLPFLLMVILGAVPAVAWEFSATPVCTLSHQGEGVAVRVTYDPTLSKPYSIAVTLNQGVWPNTAPFSIRFEGSHSFVIATDRHQVAGATVTASDTGFENVLTGLERNAQAQAVLGDIQRVISLEGAAPQVRLFRDCPVQGLV